uniref:capsule assembly Wzi family protein n=1 Tax=Ningiella ruwaisensis TaxID=2364274 RepID=UPI001F50101E|nr:capsule assembly Wzi family protein [Ningiella ruwaisensis]
MNKLAFSVVYAFIFGGSISYSSNLEASAWIGTQDKQLHYDVQTLAEWGYINSAVTTFPIPWKGVADELASIDDDSMPYMPAQALKRLQHYLSINKRQQSRQFITLQASSDEVRFRSLDDGTEETGKLSISKEFYHQRWSGQLTANYASGGRTNFDNSFLAYQFGDWNLRVGSLDQFWGPAQSSSLILSNNTRPIKSVALSRSLTTESESRWLSWLGPWYFTTQLGQLDSNRIVPDARVIMTRFTSRPFKGFEWGASWVAMWGGDGQPDSLSDLWKVITFEATCELPEGCTDAQVTKQGNHLAGFDISYSFTAFSRPVSIYAQRIGEDAVHGYKVTDNANLFGVSTYIHTAKVFLETSDTNVACAGQGSTITNCYYEHGTYQTGYRMYGRALGSTFDSDAKQITLGANYRFEDGAVAEVYLRSAELNPDGTRPSPVLTEDVTEDVLELSGYYQKPVGNWLLKAGGSVANREFVNQDDEVDALVYLKAQYAF